MIKTCHRIDAIASDAKHLPGFVGCAAGFEQPPCTAASPFPRRWDDPSLMDFKESWISAASRTRAQVVVAIELDVPAVTPESNAPFQFRAP